jgi:hypothetical protein
VEDFETSLDILFCRMARRAYNGVGFQEYAIFGAPDAHYIWSVP